MIKIFDKIIICLVWEEYKNEVEQMERVYSEQDSLVLLGLKKGLFEEENLVKKLEKTLRRDLKKFYAELDEKEILRKKSEFLARFSN